MLLQTNAYLLQAVAPAGECVRILSTKSTMFSFACFYLLDGFIVTEY